VSASPGQPPDRGTERLPDDHVSWSVRSSWHRPQSRPRPLPRADDEGFV